MKKMTKVLLVICCMVFCLCGCGNSVEAESVKNTENLEGASTFYTVDPVMYEHFLCWADAEEHEIIDIEIQSAGNDQIGYLARFMYNEDKTADEEICRYKVHVYNSNGECEFGSGLEEKLETGKYAILNEKYVEGGKYVITLKQSFAVVKLENTENEYSFTTSDGSEYLVVLSWMIEDLEYEITEIDLKDDEYTIIYKKTEDMPLTQKSSEDIQDVYAVYRCFIHEYEVIRADMLEMGFEILDESFDTESNRCFFTIRMVQ